MDSHPLQPARIACVSVPDFLLQLAVRKLPAEFAQPVALVDRTDNRSTVWAVDQRASKKGLFPGLRYVNAVALCPDLHAVFPNPQEIERVHQRIIRRLLSFSPEVEPVAELPGAYYLNVKGMERLEPDLTAWAQSLLNRLCEKEQLEANIALGFTRFGVLTAINSTHPITVFGSISEELSASCAMPLAKLNLPLRPLKELKKLGIHTIGELRSLPEWEVRARYSEELFSLIQKAKSTAGKVCAVHLPKAYKAQFDFEYVVSDIEQILVAIQRIWSPLLEGMNDLAQGVSKMRLWMKKDISGDCHIQLKTSEPTLNEATLTELLRLRMNSMNLQEGVTEIAIQLIPGDLPNPQLGLFQNLTKSELGLRAANRALARVCAEFGIEQVLIARCMNSHLPEESYQWKTFSSLRDHATQHQNYAAIVRRVLDQPRRISVPRRTSLQCTTGPYSIYGFWWRKTMIHRNYYFLENKSGSVQWVFYDHVGRQWYAQGFVQ